MRVGGWMNELLLRYLWTEEDWGSSRKARVREGEAPPFLSFTTQSDSLSLHIDGRTEAAAVWFCSEQEEGCLVLPGLTVWQYLKRKLPHSLLQ